LNKGLRLIFKKGEIMELVNSFRRYLLDVIPKTVVKNSILADEKETIDSRREGDLFVSASLGVDLFQSYTEYSVEEINKAGISDVSQAYTCHLDKYQIPIDKRDAVLAARRKNVVDKYEEKNDYYRMLNGQRLIGQEPVYVSPSEIEKFGYVGVGPVALDSLPGNIIAYMENDGMLDDLFKRYPEHIYIPFMGSRKVDIVTARSATDYQLLYMPKNDNGYRFYRDFIFYYEEARQYFLACVYNHNYNSRYDQYHGFIGFMILHMAIQRTLNGLFKIVADRDFYDMDSIHTFLEAYQIPYIDMFTMNQQRLLVKNLNILLRQKGDTQVLYNILDLLGYSNFELNKYILVKQHTMSKENEEAELKPEFHYKTSIDEDGNPCLELDKSKMYDYYFVAVPMDATDVVVEDFQDVTAYRYREFVMDDPTWIQDNELDLALEQLNMNYIETKYADINMTIRMQEVNFELTYLSRLIMDRWNQTNYIAIDIPIITSGAVSLFDIWILLICLLCKRNEVEPDIILTPSKTLSILGFNFNADIDVIKQEIIDRPDIYDQGLLKYIKDFQFGTILDVNMAYSDVKALSELLISVMQKTNDPVVYHANLKLYNTLLLTTRNNQIFKKSDGTIATQYTELLEDISPALYEFYCKIDTPEESIDYINYIATKMTTLLDATKYLSYLNPIDVTIISGLLAILRAFKSFTVDIKEISTMYLFDSRLDNMMKMMDSTKMTVHVKYSDNAIRFNDAIHLVESHVRVTDKADMVDGVHLETTLHGHSPMIMHDKLMNFDVELKNSDLIDLTDTIHQFVTHVKTKDNLHLSDSFVMWWEDP
jgi:hypothetical protein